MARPLQVLSLLSRLGALCATPSVSINSCRSASRGASRARMGPSPVHRDRASNRAHGDDMSVDDELEDVEDKLQAVVDEARKGQRTLKYHILRRQMTPPGAPQRKLTWDAIEQIRYLKREQPDEWTVQRLAEGYSVTPDVILRVLRSNHVPAPDRKIKQDAKVMSGLGQPALPSGAGTEQNRLKLPGHHTSAALPPGSRERAVVPVAEQTVMLRGDGTGSLAKIPAPATLQATQFRAGSKDVAVTRSEEEDGASNTNPSKDDKEDEESWDGQLLTDKELEEFMEKPYPVVQVGNEFFDGEGNLLYRI
ncbi:neugrin [Anarrhichthys ocellatus]|uniref:neugrin n=1 Tax=Anarrhichthys ocellatus TaxID=433405 RepID=UPI0012ED317A|nr:neugrin [Anarrhichthys ocellatus]